MNINPAAVTAPATAATPATANPGVNWTGLAGSVSNISDAIAKGYADAAAIKAQPIPLSTKLAQFETPQMPQKKVIFA